MTATNMTDLKNSTNLTPIDGFGGFIRPTETERLAGRLMRAPDHDAGTGGDAAASGDGDGGNAEAGSEGADGGDKGADGEGTVLGDATAGTGDGEGDGEKGKDGDDGDDKGAADSIPENYELKVTVKDAEGKDAEIEIDTELLAEATPVLKEVGLSNEAANKLAPFVVKAQERFAQRQADEFATVKADWAKAAQSDPEIGGQNWKASTSLAAKALDHFVGPVSTKDEAGNDVPNEFRTLLNESGLGNHPSMIRAFRKIGEALAEDGNFARGDRAIQPKKSQAEILYPEDVPTTK